MIELFFAPTPNGWKLTIFLEEAELPFRITPVFFADGGQFAPEFLAHSPNNRMPALVDHAPADGGPPLSLFESGAMLHYLARKTGRFLPSDPRGEARVMQWLMWQMAGFGPMLGQHGHFALYAAEKHPYAIQRYRTEAERLYGVLDRQLAATGAHVAGDDYSIADMAIFPWAMTHKAQGFTLDDWPAVKRWYAELRARPALQRGLSAGKEIFAEKREMDDAARARFFGLKPA
ncbi:glutathione binding-like protein [Novosphingobium tardum]|uniref:Glutathione binding-like protein n=1 Tax=Novosphingobium tardum TaxID=1538021 RepID=A0ABV8RPX5_9SPHN